MVDNPLLRLDMGRLAAAATSEVETPKSTRRHVSRKLSRYIEFFEQRSQQAASTEIQTARAVISTTPRPDESHDPPRRTGSVRDIIKRFDPDGSVSYRSLRRESSVENNPPPLQRAVSLQPISSVNSSPGFVKWQQVEKKVAGTVVGKVWRRMESTPPPIVKSPAVDDAKPIETSSSQSGGDDDPFAKCGAPGFDPIGEESDDEDEDSSSPSSCDDGVRSSTATGPRTKMIPQSPSSLGASAKPKRASHFVAIRIDEEQVVDAVRRFQSELINSAPFLDHCKSNPQKLHLTLLVLSLNTHEIERAKIALVHGVRRFMTEKASMLAAFRTTDSNPRRSEYIAQTSAYPPQFFGAAQPPMGGDSSSRSSPSSTDHGGGGADPPFLLDFRTIGAFGTRVLFLSPPLRQRLLLQSFHVELARAFGDQGIPIVGAGSGWNSAMEIQKQVRGEAALSSPEVTLPAPVEPPSSRPPKTPQPSSSTSKTRAEITTAASINVVTPIQHVFPETATPLDKALLRQYDLSSARTTLYIPQITLFKISKAAKRNKSKQPPSQSMPKLKLFPRLYHNLVQRVLQSGLPPPRPLRSREGNAPEAFKPQPPTYMMDPAPWAATTPIAPPGHVYIYQLPTWVASTPHDKRPAPASPFAYGSPVDDGYARNDFHRLWKYDSFSPSRGAYTPYHMLGAAPSTPTGSCSSAPRVRNGGGVSSSSRRLKVDRIVTTSQMPDPPFGRQRCVFIELLEMSQMDLDGYYKRICRVELSPEAAIIPHQ